MPCQVEPHVNCRIHILYNDQLQMSIPRDTTREVDRECGWETITCFRTCMYLGHLC